MIDSGPVGVVSAVKYRVLQALRLRGGADLSSQENFGAMPMHGSRVILEAFCMSSKCSLGISQDIAWNYLALTHKG